MGTQVTVFEPIKPPDPRRPTAMPSLPEWVASRLASVSANVQRDANTGKVRELTVLPAQMMPGPAERRAIEAHLLALASLLDLTPEKSPEAEAELVVLITKMLLTLGGAKATAQAAEAKGEAYSAALEDVPSWATAAALRRWYRGDAKPDSEKDPPFNFTFAPAPAELRKLALREKWVVAGRAFDLRRLLEAQPLVEYSTSHCARMTQAVRGLIHMAVAGQPVKDVTIDSAAAYAERLALQAPK